LNDGLRIEARLLLPDLNLEVHVLEVVLVVVMVVMVMVMVMMVMRVLVFAQGEADVAVGELSVEFFQDYTDAGEHLGHESSVPDSHDDEVDEEVEHRDDDENGEVEGALAGFHRYTPDEKTKEDKEPDQRFGSLRTSAAPTHNITRSHIDLLNRVLFFQLNKSARTVKLHNTARACTQYRRNIHAHIYTFKTTAIRQRNECVDTEPQTLRETTRAGGERSNRFGQRDPLGFHSGPRAGECEPPPTRA